MSLRKVLLDICHRVYEKGFVSAYDGNLSVRLSNKRILITPSGKCKGELAQDDFLEIDYNGKLLKGKGKVSTEVKIHLLAYSKRDDINSVIHCHPVYATAFASSGLGLTEPVLPEVILTLGKVPLCKYGTPSTDEVPLSMLPHIDYVWALLLENHGAVTFGHDIMSAYYRMEKLEYAAHTIAVCRLLGGEKTIPAKKLRQLYSVAEKEYGIILNKKNRMDF